MRLPVITFATLAAAVPYPLPNNTLDLPILRRETTSGVGTISPCQVPGVMLCNGPKLIGECDIEHKVTWGSVPAGTICHCDSPDNCMFVASDNGPYGSNPEPAPSHAVPSGTATPAYTPPASTSNPAPAPSNTTGGSSYQVYNGNGSPEQGWPVQSDWLSFEKLWNGYESLIGQNCMSLPTHVPNNSPEETANLRQAIWTESKRCGVPSAFALAIMMQESTGCVKVATTNNGVVNPGIYQSHNGNGTCFNMSVCPAGQIQQMARDGICGTSAPGGDGLQQLGEKAGSSGAERWYRVARRYNSGSDVPVQNLDLGEGATPCYVMDVVNRLMGNWFTGSSGCTLTAQY